MEKDIVIGTAVNYSFNQIKYWANSLDMSGFTGHKLLLTVGMDNRDKKILLDRNYTILDLQVKANEFSPVVDRFFYYWKWLKDGVFKDIRYLIATDVKDVIFQTNPSVWLENNLIKSINASTESLKYSLEPWGRHNLYMSFGPHIYNELKDNLIYNAGVMSGKFNELLDLFLNIFLLCENKPRLIDGGGGPDQAAYNILLGLNPYKENTQFNMSESGWAAQLGTTGPQVNFDLSESKPKLTNNLVCTSAGTPFCIVHQYDRAPNWKNIIEKKYV